MDHDQFKALLRSVRASAGRTDLPLHRWYEACARAANLRDWNVLSAQISGLTDSDALSIIQRASAGLVAMPRSDAHLATAVPGTRKAFRLPPPDDADLRRADSPDRSLDKKSAAAAFHVTWIDGYCFYGIARGHLYLRSGRGAAHLGNVALLARVGSGWAVCKYSAHEPKINISALSDAGRRQLSQEFGIQIGQRVPPAGGIIAFYESPAFEGLVRFVQKHPRKDLGQTRVASSYMPMWYECARAGSAAPFRERLASRALVMSL